MGDFNHINWWHVALVAFSYVVAAEAVKALWRRR